MPRTLAPLNARHRRALSETASRGRHYAALNTVGMAQRRLPVRQEDVAQDSAWGGSGLGAMSKGTAVLIGVLSALVYAAPCYAETEKRKS